MTVEKLLEKYRVDKANLNITRMTIVAIRQEILDESSVQTGDRVQTSGTSDPTSAKALRVIDKTSSLEHRAKQLELRCRSVEQAVNALTDREHEIIERIFFRGQSYTEIDRETSYPRGTCKRVKKEALDKLNTILSDILEMSPIWSQNDPDLSR